MPVLFVHGVNVRDREQNRNDAFAMRDLLCRKVIGRLADDSVGQFADIKLDPLLVESPYWGDDGVKFRWQEKTLPKIKAIDIMGGEDDPREATGPQLAALAELLESRDPSTPEDQMLLSAARADFSRFMEVVLAPVLRSEVRLTSEDFDSVEFEQHAEPAAPALEALLVTAADEIVEDGSFQALLDDQVHFPSDDDLIEELEAALVARFKQLADEYERAQTAPARDGIDVLGGRSWGGFFKESTDRIGEFFVRLAHAPSRVPSVLTLKAVRKGLNSVVTRFSGDVFEYLHCRGNRSAPGAIVQAVLDALDSAANDRPGEPLIVVTHSMGGNIFYDILTHFRPHMEVEVWLSVGGQVGLFEEMKLFHASDRMVEHPQKVDELHGRVKCWLNIYDPADAAAFLASPVFNRVKDVPFSTGIGDYHAHLNYFKRKRLYDTVYRELKGAYEK